MKIAKNKTKAIAIAMFLMLSMAASMMLVPTANAHTPAWSFTTFAFIKVAPDPVGVGQKVNVIMWIDKVCYGAAYVNNIRFHNYKLTITKPDNTTETKTWDVCQDTTSGQYYGYTPDKVGKYTFKFEFPEQTYTYTTPVEIFGVGLIPNEYTNDTYLASSATATITVQEESVTAITSYPLPSEYWTRPIYGENTDWWSISSNWLGTGAPGYSGGSVYGYVSDAVGSQTSHVMWTKPIQSGGVVGGNQYFVQGDTFFEGSAYINRYTNPIVIDGKIYYSEPLGFSSGTGRQTDCVDLRTGKLIWARSDVPTPSFALIPNVPPANPNQHGVFPPMLVAAGSGFFGPAGVPPGTWVIFDADTGDWLYNATNIPSGTSALGPNGEIMMYVLQNKGNFTNPNYYLGEWNSTNLFYSVVGGFGLSPAGRGSVFDASSSRMYDWNVSVSSLNTMTSTPSVVTAYYGDTMLFLSGILPSGGFAFAMVSSAPYTYFALNLNASKGALGSTLWTKTYYPPTGAANNVTVFDAGCSPVSRVFVESYKETGQWVGYSLDTGAKLWGPTISQTAINPLDYYGNQFSGASIAELAYGNVYTSEFGGILYCFDAKTGNLKWTYGNGGSGNSTNAGYNAARGNYPTFIAAIGNGIIYLETTEHTVTTPIYKGAMTRAVNATDGTEIWTLSAYTGGGASGSSYALADGFATFYNGYDNQIYVVGRGPSATTVTASPKVSTYGGNVLIEGSVTDISAGTKQEEQAARFPNGVACASDASMKDWMGYVYQQKPLPTNFAGVQVTIDVLDSNFNYRTIGSATIDASGKYSLTWTPDIAGNYTVIANFAGTKGYWPSYSETAFNVMEAPQATATPTPTPASMADLYFLPLSIGMIIAIVIVGALLALLMLRKRP
jgi:outer membrane protein assembly factor BamB